MKKSLLILPVFLIISFMSFAQFKKGDVLLGGQLSYSSSESNYSNTAPPFDKSKTTYGYFGISAGKALTEHSVFGLSFSYNPTTRDNYYGSSTTPQKYLTNGFSAGIFFRTYKPLGKEFYFFGEINGAYLFGNSTLEDDAGNKLQTGSFSGGSMNIYPGISYRISKVFFIELSIPNLFGISYTSGNDALSTLGKTKNFTVNTSLTSNPLSNLGIGFRLIL